MSAGSGRELSVDQQLSVVAWVWTQQPAGPGWLWMGWMDRGPDGSRVAWRDRWFRRRANGDISEDVASEISGFLAEMEGRDVYFSPTVYARRRRTKEAAQPSRVVHADYDATDPRAFAPALVPQMVWETSPGSWQGLHILREPLELDEWERLSRRITRGLGADRGCWDMPHPIRVPGRRNHKPARIAEHGPSGAPGRLIRWRRGEAVDPTEQPEWIALPEPEDVEAFDPGILLPVTSGESGEAVSVALSAARAALPAGVRRMLSQEVEGDRSEHVHATAKEMLRAGLTVDMAGALLVAESRAFQDKYGNRRDKGRQVRREIEAALRALTAEGWSRDLEGGGRLREPKPDVEALAGLTDYGNAARLIARHGADIRWVDQWMCWVVWDPDRRQWRRDVGREVRRRVHELAKDLIRDAAEVEDGKTRSAMLKHGVNSLSASATSNALQQAQAFPGVVVEAQDFDNAPHVWVDAEGVVVDLRTGATRPCEPGDLITKRGGVSLPPEGTRRQPMRWLKFLEETFGAETIPMVKRLVGATMVGTAKKWFVVLQGPTDSGKSQFQHIISGIFGDWGGTVKRDTFAYSRWEKANQDGLADLAGVRFATWSETKEGMRVDEALLKDLTDGVGLPKMVSRKYEKTFPMVPTMTFWMDTNHKPQLRHGDDALWNRVVLLHTLRRVPKEEQVEGLAEMILDTEGPLILRWALEGAREWLAEGAGKAALGIVERVETQVDEWRGQADTLGRWFDEVLEPLPPRRVEEAVTRKALVEAWNEETGQGWTPQRMGKELLARQMVTGAARDDPMKWKGVRHLPGHRWARGMGDLEGEGGA